MQKKNPKKTNSNKKNDTVHSSSSFQLSKKPKKSLLFKRDFDKMVS
jgi:hypothetical protein